MFLDRDYPTDKWKQGDGLMAPSENATVSGGSYRARENSCSNHITKDKNNGIEIIKHGTIPETTLEFICRNCGCVFKQKGCYKRVSDQREGDFFSIKCPECDNQVNKKCE